VVGLTARLARSGLRTALSIRTPVAHGPNAQNEPRRHQIPNHGNHLSRRRLDSVMRRTLGNA